MRRSASILAAFAILTAHPAAAQSPAMPDDPRLQEAYLAWDAGDYPTALRGYLEVLKAAYEPAIWDGRDGLVRTFAALCTASVAYQKRLEPSLTTALEGADGKTLLRWSLIVLPALKGEPHARARSVVEARLYRIPRSIAQQIAEFLKIKLRVRY